MVDEMVPSVVLRSDIVGVAIMVPLESSVVAIAVDVML